MELYTLDAFLRREEVIDRFESLIWTERQRAFGDFEVILPSTVRSRTLLKEGTKLAMNESYRGMTVEIVEDTVDDEGRAMLKARGRSFEMLLDDRVVRNTLSDLTTEPYWDITDVPGDIMRTMFDHICRTPSLDAADGIPYLQPGSLFSAGTIPEPTDTVTIRIDPGSLYKALSDVAEIYDMGYRLLRNFDQSELYFDIYTGDDRTSSQNNFPAVVFSPNLDNLKNTTSLTSNASYKNCAYVFSPVGHELVYLLDVDPSTTGFERKVLFVKADDITDTTPSVASAKMIQRGKEELAKNRKFSAFDGELNQNSMYKYGVDYNLGDLVELQNVDGAITNMRVTEQIFVSDSEGERSYPTLAMNLFITPGSWLGWDFNQVWQDLGATEYWEDQP